MKKYELTDIRSGNLRRIRALRDIPRYRVKAGDLGGWIESEENLSQFDDCWIGEDAQAEGHALIDGNAWVGGTATVCENAFICDNARVDGDTGIAGYAKVLDNAQVRGNAFVSGFVEIKGNACVYGNARIGGITCLQANARVQSSRDYLSIGPMYCSNDYATFYRTETGIWVCRGRFNGSIDEFEVAVRKTHGNSQCARAHLAAIELAKIQL